MRKNVEVKKFKGVPAAEIKTMKLEGSHFKKKTAEIHRDEIIRKWKKKNIMGRISVRKKSLTLANGKKTYRWNVYTKGIQF